jgi:hypothetical protein
MPWYLWLPIFAIALHQFNHRKDEVVQLLFIVLTSAALCGLIFSSSWILHLVLVAILLALPLGEKHLKHYCTKPCRRNCFSHSTCHR